MEKHLDKKTLDKLNKLKDIQNKSKAYQKRMEIIKK